MQIKNSGKISAALLSALFLATSLTACASDTNSDKEDSELDMQDGWVRVSEYSDHVDGMTGAFAKFTNNSDHVITIVGGSSPIAQMVETHEVVEVDGEMKMQAKEGGIEIKPGETLTLEPGGLHIMLMGLTKPILEGDTVELTIDLEGADDVTVMWPAKASLAGDESYQPKM